MISNSKAPKSRAKSASGDFLSFDLRIQCRWPSTAVWLQARLSTQFDEDLYYRVIIMNTSAENNISKLTTLNSKLFIYLLFKKVSNCMRCAVWRWASRRTWASSGWKNGEKREKWWFGTMSRNIPKIFLKYLAVSFELLKLFISQISNVKLSYFSLPIAPQKYKDLVLPWRPSR